MRLRAFSIVPFALALSLTPGLRAQTTDNAMVAGTGTTVAELRDLGWTSDQITQMQTPGTQEPNRANAPVASDTGGGRNWGLLGLLGLLGLMGLGGRRRAAVHDERDIRRVA